MGQEPEQVLPQQGATAAAYLEGLTAHHQTAWQEEARTDKPIHELQERGCFERREGEQQEKGCNQLRPDKEWQPHPREAWRA